MSWIVNQGKIGVFGEMGEQRGVFDVVETSGGLHRSVNFAKVMGQIGGEKQRENFSGSVGKEEPEMRGGESEEELEGRTIGLGSICWRQAKTVACLSQSSSKC